MCFSASFSFFMVCVGFGTAAYLHFFQKTPFFRTLTFLYFGTMEALQLAQHMTPGQCDNFVNKASTILSYVHMCFQVKDIFSSQRQCVCLLESCMDNEKLKKKTRCILTFLTFLSRSWSTCGPGPWTPPRKRCVITRYTIFSYNFDTLLLDIIFPSSTEEHWKIIEIYTFSSTLSRGWASGPVACSSFAFHFSLSTTGSLPPSSASFPSSLPSKPPVRLWAVGLNPSVALSFAPSQVNLQRRAYRIPCFDMSAPWKHVLTISCVSW